MADKTYSGVLQLAVDAVGIRFVKNIMAPTRDGTRLAMDIHVPPARVPGPLSSRTSRTARTTWRRSPACNTTGRSTATSARVDFRDTVPSEGLNEEECRPVEMRDGHIVVD